MFSKYLKVSSLALSTLSYIHYLLPPSSFSCLLHLLNIVQWSFMVYQRYLQQTHHRLISSASDIIFITCQNHRQMTNNMTCKGNINASNNISVIIFSRHICLNGERLGWYNSCKGFKFLFFVVGKCLGDTYL